MPGFRHGFSLEARLRALLATRRVGVRQRWNRDLPLPELLTDRWERARRLGFGEGASIYDSAIVFGDVAVGDHTWIGPHVILDGTGGLSIGAYCSISTGVQVYTHDSVKWAVTGGAAEYERSPVGIGDCCYIGPLTVIARGVTIGDHSIVSAGSFVNRDVPPFSIVGGTPARRLGEVRISRSAAELVYD